MKNILLYISFCVVIALAGCSSKSSTTKGPSAEDVQAVSKVLVLPTKVMSSDESTHAAKNQRLQSGAVFMDDVIQAELAGNPRIAFIGDPFSRSSLTSVDGGIVGQVRKLGEDYGCDAVLVVTLEQFKDRVGGNASVESPASAEFAMRLIETDSGRVLWSSSFKETQEALMSNVFSFGKVMDRGFKWITVEEMVGEALRDMLQDCPYLVPYNTGQLAMGRM